MTDFAGIHWKGKNGDAALHPPREQLLLWQDGELPDNESQAIKAHLEACWKCRAHAAEIGATITAFIQFDEAMLADCSQPPNGWREFGTRLRHVAVANGAPSWRTRWRNWWPRTSSSFQPLRGRQSRWAMAVMLVVGLAALSFWLVRSTPVSARELLQRTMQAENASLQKVAEPVLYHKLQVRRKTARATDAVMWESWRAAHVNQFRQRVADQQGIRFVDANDNSPPPLLTDIAQILTVNHLDVERPLSAVAFDEWRAQVRNGVEMVNTSGANLLLIVQPPAPYSLHAIRQASLLVRRQDWHVIALQLQVQGDADIDFYELSEAAYEVMPLDALTVFANLVLPRPAAALVTPRVTPTVAPAPTAVPSPLPSPLAPLPSVTALQQAEVTALYALHQARADLGEQIEVLRENGRHIVVRGLVQTAARKAELLQALNAITLVQPQLQTIDEAIQQATAPPTTNNEAVVTVIDVSVKSSETVANVNPLQQKLSEYFGGRKGMDETERAAVNHKITQFYSAIETDASAATAEAWALRRWQDRCAALASDGVELAPASRQQLDEILKNHIARLRQRAQSLQARLRPVCAALGIEAENMAPSSIPNRAAKIQLVFQTVEQVNRLSDRLIAGKSAEPLPATARSLLTALARLETVLRTLEES
ncbi:MAG: zf-HC2 domain-containing protein [Blastocatellia bacterium]